MQKFVILLESENCLSCFQILRPVSSETAITIPCVDYFWQLAQQFCQSLFYNYAEWQLLGGEAKLS